jgi:ketosteroid isomerase-like protein
MAKKAAKSKKDSKAKKPVLPYEYYVDIVTKRYFHGVDNRLMDLILDCFDEDAVLTEATSGTVHKGREGIRKMFETLFSSFDRIWHGNFVHTADPVANAVCSQFSVEIEPKGSGKTLRYENCNRFYMKDRRFSRVFVYMSGDNLLK